MSAALLTVAPSRRHQTAPVCDVINVRQGRGEACARPGMVRGGPAPPWSRNDRRYRWRTPPSCPRAPCRTGTASGSATSTPRSPSERPAGRAGGRPSGCAGPAPPSLRHRPASPRGAALRGTPVTGAPPPSTRSPSPGLPSVLSSYSLARGSALSPAPGAGARLPPAALHIRLVARLGWG